MTISASRYPFANVMPPGRRSEDWINSISRTLQWNSRQRQKAFHEWDAQQVKGRDLVKDIEALKVAEQLLPNPRAEEAPVDGHIL